MKWEMSGLALQILNICVCLEKIDEIFEHLEKTKQKEKGLFFDSNCTIDFICSYSSKYMA